ncbi:MAG: integrin alpha, partial [Ignavibacteria bacterium]
MKEKILFLILLTCIFSLQFHHAVANNQNESKQNSSNTVTIGSDDPSSDILLKDRLSSLTYENGRLLNKNKYLPPDNETDAIQQRYFTGYAADDFFGYSVANAGDVNGDGFDDLIVGAPQNDAVAPDAGRAYIYFGGNIINSGVDVILSGVATGDKFGWTVAGAGDLNSDGYDDVIVGAPFNDNGGTDAGRAYIFFGGSPMNNSVDVTLTGSNAQDNFGLSVSAAGDVNANGFADVIVGAPGSDGGGTNAGRAQIYFGGNPMNNSVDVTLNGLTAQDNFGTSVSYAGDVNGDGFSDVVCGAPNNDAAGTNAGRAYVYLGSNPMNTTADLTITGAAANDNFGYSVSGNGDVNGDGYSDVISGAPLNDAGGSNSGSVYVYFGGATLD